MRRLAVSQSPVKDHQLTLMGKTLMIKSNNNNNNNNEKAEWINNMKREPGGFEKGPKAEIHIDLLKTTLKRYQIGKRQAMMEHMVSGSINSPSFTTD